MLLYSIDVVVYVDKIILLLFVYICMYVVVMIFNKRS